MLKSGEKKEIVEQTNKLKQIETALRQVKTKLQVCENVVQKKDFEIEHFKAKLEKIDAAEQKYAIRDRQTFEAHFGHKPRPTEEKYVNFLRMYET